ncbi:hypothetical protein EZ449_14160 [Pedobacter frigidisoli]|uniref:Uncharacterized protein n=1 Tax=Pedobacter frigidisoli TaxID=2530455 RepID=A0A4R0NZQ4_9SPHI|nr:hypothetical protein [Pedobacter frigidisoli]TCD07675.1 hypothetical protein EZ449_14160 [Pedobacter frigidisoli]
MKIFSKVKNALKGANRFGIAAILVAGVMAFSFKPDARRLGALRYNPAPQTWNATLDQTPGNYSTIGSPSSVSCTDSDKICTYDLVDGEYVQSTKGDFAQ